MTQDQDIQWREPMAFAAGDMLAFQRNLPDFPASNDWSLIYEIRGDGQPIQFVSVAAGDFHSVEVDGPVTALWAPAKCVLVGFAVNAANNERHQIYYGEFEIFPNAGAAGNVAPQTTHAQRMVSLLESQLEKLAAHALLETDVQQTRILREKRLDLEKQLAINIEKRRQEIAQESVRNGNPSGNKIMSQFNIVNNGSSRAVNQTGNLIP